MDRAGGFAGLAIANGGSCAQPAKELNGDAGGTLGRLWDDVRDRDVVRSGCQDVRMVCL